MSNFGGDDYPFENQDGGGPAFTGDGIKFKQDTTLADMAKSNTSPLFPAYSRSEDRCIHTNELVCFFESSQVPNGDLKCVSTVNGLGNKYAPKMTPGVTDPLRMGYDDLEQSLCFLGVSQSEHTHIMADDNKFGTAIVRTKKKLLHPRTAIESGKHVYACLPTLAQAKEMSRIPIMFDSLDNIVKYTHQKRKLRALQMIENGTTFQEAIQSPRDYLVWTWIQYKVATVAKAAAMSVQKDDKKNPVLPLLALEVVGWDTHSKTFGIPRPEGWKVVMGKMGIFDAVEEYAKRLGRKFTKLDEDKMESDPDAVTKALKGAQKRYHQACQAFENSLKKRYIGKVEICIPGEYAIVDIV